MSRWYHPSFKFSLPQSQSVQTLVCDEPVPNDSYELLSDWMYHFGTDVIFIF